MEQVGVRELKQNASAVLRRVAAGESLVVTDRGRPVARLSPIRKGGLQELIDAGLVTMPTGRLSDAPPPIALKPGQMTAGEALALAREHER
jgi:prevent-host-death family protein